MTNQHLGELNTTQFFCRECGISPAPKQGEDCPTCVRITRAAWGVDDEPLPLGLHIALTLGLIVVCIGIWLALQVV